MYLNNVYHSIDSGFAENSLYLEIVVRPFCPWTHGSAGRIGAFGLEGKFFQIPRIYFDMVFQNLEGTAAEVREFHCARTMWAAEERGFVVASQV